MRLTLNKMRPSPALLVAIVALVVALGGVAYATIPDSGGVIRGCFDSGGNLKVIDTGKGQSCAKGFTPLNWNQQGPKGDTGAQGPAGPAGANGVSGYDVETRSISIPPGGSQTGVQCPNGKAAISGGWDGQFGVSLLFSFPETSQPGASTPDDVWHFGFDQEAGVPQVSLTLYAICVNAS